MKNVDPLQRQKRKKNKQKRERERGRGKKGENKIVSEVVRRGKCIQPRSTAAGQPGKHRSTPFSELKES